MANSNTPQIQYAVCYIRKSREDEQAERRGEDTLAKQRDMLREDVLSRYTFQYDIAEEVASGDSIRERPVFRELLLHLGSKYQAIVCKDLSRLGRGSYSDMGIVYDIIRDKRIFIITKDAIYDPHNFSDLRMIRFSLFFNREEYEMTLWRLTEGKYDGAERGKWVAGSVPYGYVYDRQSQNLRPLEEQAEIVRSIFDWYVYEKLGYQAIANRLTSLSIKTPRGKSKWHSEVIRRILNNPAYHGTLAFRLTKRNKLDGKVVKRPVEEQIIVPHAFTPIVDESIWEKAISKRGSFQKQAAHVQTSQVRCELAGIVTCETCENKLVRQSSKKSYKKKNGAKTVYEKEFLYCKTCGYAVSYRDCEKQIVEILRRIPIRDTKTLIEKYQNLSNLQDKRHSGSFDITESIYKQLIQRKESTQRRLARARDMLLDDVLSKDEYLEVCSQYDQELVQISEALMHQKEPNKKELKKQVSPSCLSNFRTVSDVYQFLSTPDLKNQLLQSVVHLAQVKVSQKDKGQKRRFLLRVWIKFGGERDSG